MNSRTLRLLEWNRVLELLENQTACSLGRARVRDLKAQSTSDARRAQVATTEARRFLESQSAPPFGGISDVSASLKRAQIGASLDAPSLLQIAQFAGGARRLREAISSTRREDFPILHSFATQIVPRSDIEKAIFEAIDEGNGEVKDDASLDILRARRNIRQTQSNIQQRLRAMLSDSNVQPHLQDAFVTMRDGRYCLPVKAEARGRVPGIVHDRSGSGGAFFVEPQAVVEANNRLRELQAEEREAVRILLLELSIRVGGATEDLFPAIEATGELDFVFAKGHLSRQMNAIEPQLLDDNAQPEYCLVQACHPLVKGCVPNDIYLGGADDTSSTRSMTSGFDILLITGPNTGGKTVVLKTLGLLSIMAACGLHLPVGAGSKLRLPREVWADIGDEQSIEQSLSTFSAHIKNIVGILRGVQSGDLVLLDEAGAGTDPDEGAALAKAVLRSLQRRGAQVVATTHYGELKQFALSAMRFRNASVEFDVKTLRPTYRLRIGVPGASNALDIAQRLGMPSELVSRARRYLGQEHQESEAATQQLEATQRELSERTESAERERGEVEKVKREYSKKLELLQLEMGRERERLQRESRQILQKTQDEADAILRELRGAARESKETEAARQKLKTLKSNAPQAPKTNNAGLFASEKDATETSSTRSSANIGGRLISRINPETRSVIFPNIGDAVMVKSFNKEGVLLSSPDHKNRVEVRIGAVKVGVAASDISSLKTTKTVGGVSTIQVRKGGTVEDEINVIGKNVEEAIGELDSYIDGALLAETATFRVVHGKGTGTLRRAIHDYLARHGSVIEYSIAPPNEGGEGATVVSLG